MKKLLALMMLCALASCKDEPAAHKVSTGEVSHNEPNVADKGRLVIDSKETWYHSVSVVDHFEGGIHYKVFTSTEGAIFVVNYTIDSLNYFRNDNTRKHTR